MIYYTIKQNRKPVQLKFEDVLFGTVNIEKWTGESDRTATITRCVENIPERIQEKNDIQKKIDWLKMFNRLHEDLFQADRESLYTSFKIPKKTGGWRPIDAPKDELQKALQELVKFLQDDCELLYHTAAFAYIKDRCILDAARKHAKFNSNWFLKTDISGFFPHTTLDFAMRMLSRIYPLSEICKDAEGRAEFEKAISLGFFKGGLPQGTVLSPVLTNMVFLPLDHRLFGEFSKRAMVYTRYADDMHISAKENFPYKTMVKIITDAFEEFGAPYQIKSEKTHYGSVKGKNWMLGLMLNANHNITVGWRRKKYFKAALCNFILDTKNGKPWDLDEVRHLQGELSYFRMVEKDYFNKVVGAANMKWHVNVDEMFKTYLTII